MLCYVISQLISSIDLFCEIEVLHYWGLTFLYFPKPVALAGLKNTRNKV